jgi:hypothetical protein
LEYGVVVRWFCGVYDVEASFLKRGFDR